MKQADKFISLVLVMVLAFGSLGSLPEAIAEETIPSAGETMEIEDTQTSSGEDLTVDDSSFTYPPEEEAPAASTLPEEEVVLQSAPLSTLEELAAQNLTPQEIISDEQNYSFDTNTGKLYIHYDAGATAWKDDSRINQALITSLSVGDAVTTLPDDCFFNLNLTGVVDISNATLLTSIGDRCFSYTRSMTKIILPSSVQSLGEECFSDTGLSGEVDLSNATSLATIGYRCFSGTQYSPSNITSIKLPVNVQSIAAASFAYTKITGTLDLSSLTKLEYIGDECFYKVATLKNIVLPASLQTLGTRCFYGTAIEGTLNLANATALQNIGDECFNGLGITAVTWPIHLQTIGDRAFQGTLITGALDLQACTQLTSIGAYAFSSIPHLTTLTLPLNLQTISANAFSDTRITGTLDLQACTQLTSIGARAFNNTVALTGLKLPNSLSELGASAFSNSGLTNPNGMLDLSNTALTSIPESCFRGISVSSVKLPIGITEIGEYAFSQTKLSGTLDLSALTSLTALGDFCFAGCSGIIRIALPTSIQSLGARCFNGTSLIYSTGPLDLSSLTSLTNIGACCFSGLWYINEIILPEGLQTLGEGCFTNSGLTGSMRLPSTLTSIGKNAFTNTALTSLVFTGDTAPAMPEQISHAGITGYYPQASVASYLSEAGLPQPAYPYGAQTDAKIISFTLWGEPSTIDETNKRIYVTIPSRIDITARTPTISFFGSSISPALDAAQDFTSPVTYTVTPASGPSVSYTVYVLRGTAPKSQIIHLGQEATFSVDIPAATSIQWQVDRGDGSGFVDISENEGTGAQTAEYTTPTAPVEAAGLAMSGWSYRAKLGGVSLPNDVAYTAAVTLTVTKIPRDAPIIGLVEINAGEETITLTPLEGAAYFCLNKTTVSHTGVFKEMEKYNTYVFFAMYSETATHQTSTDSNMVVVKNYEDVTPAPTIEGTMVFGQEVSADTTGFRGAISYEWLRDGVPISGAEYQNYLLTEDDIGSIISLRIFAIPSFGYSGNFISTNSTPVARASQDAPAAPTLASKEDTSITLTSVAGTEYRLGVDGAWQASPVFSGLEQSTQYTFYARFAQTSTHEASPASSAAQFATSGSKNPQSAPVPPEQEGSSTATTITVKKPASVSGEVQFACILGSAAPDTADWQDSGSFISLTPNTTYNCYMRLQETETHLASSASEALVVSTAKATLSGTVDITGAFVFGELLSADTSSIAAVPAGADKGTLAYQWLRDGEPIADATGSSYTVVAADIDKVINVQVAASNCTGTLVSTNSTVVDKAVGPSAPSVSGSYTGNGETFTYTVQSVADAEYSADNTTWQDNPSFEGFTTSSPAATFYARLKATATHNAGETGSVGPVSFVKLAQDAPRAFDLGYTWDGTSYTVTIPEVSGCEYSFDGATYSSVSGASTQTGCTIGETVTGSIRYSATGTHNASLPTQASIVLPKPITTITHTESGISVTGRFDAGAYLMAFKDSLPDEPGACSACDEIRKHQTGNKLVVLYDIILSDSYEGELELSIPVGAQYNGKTLTVLHCADGVVEQLSFVVVNGFAVGTISSLSPFAVLKPASSITPGEDTQPSITTGSSSGNTTGGTGVPRTGDTHSPLLWVSLLGLVVLGAALVRLRFVAHQ